MKQKKSVTVMGVVMTGRIKATKETKKEKIATMDRFGDRLKIAREGMSQEELGRLIGVADTQISHWETGNQLPTHVNLVRLCKALNISADYLLGFRDSPRPLPKRSS